MTDDRKNSKIGFQEYILTHYRGIITTVFLLPMSAILNLINRITRRIERGLYARPQSHERRVRQIQEQIRQWRESGAEIKLCTHRNPWKSMSELVPAYKSHYQNIKVAGRAILDIDPRRKLIRVEPQVNMGQITEALIPKGWTLAVVPELDDLTVSGLIMGFGIESSSHRYGLFQHICESIDVITPDGERLHCSKTENPDLYYLLPWSHGTLGFLVAAELKIIPAKKYVRLQYEPIHSLENLVQRFTEVSRDSDEALFVEALTFSREEAVLMTGTLADRPGGDGSVNAIGKWYKPWFYSHVQTMLDGEDKVEYIPLRQYYHRHTRSYFWEMQDIIPFGNRAWFRWLLGWAMPPHIQLLKRFQTDTIQQLRQKHHIVQDVIMPLRNLDLSLEYFDAHYRMHPLWLCPARVSVANGEPGLLRSYRDEEGVEEELFVDIGAYGSPGLHGFDGNRELGLLEQFVIDHGGFQALYAKTLMSELQFRQMFDLEDYDRMRAKIPYAKEAFDDVYDKVVRGRVFPNQMGKKQAVTAPPEVEKSR